jgi:hypothetical protein
VHVFDQADRLLLHLDDEAIDQRPEMAPEDHARDGDEDAEARVVQRHGDTVRQLLRIGAPGACEPKISIIPTTVPNSPISGLIEAMVPSVVR